MRSPVARVFCRLVVLTVPLTCPLTAAAETQLVRLSEQQWESWVPEGKEVDCIYGDYVLRNQQLTAVIAQPLQSRNANMTVRNVGGMLIDLTSRTKPNDQLSAYYPGGGTFTMNAPGPLAVGRDGQSLEWDGAEPLAGQTLRVSVASRPREDGLRLTVHYELAADQPFLRVETVYENGGDKPVTVALRDAIRADRTFTFGSAHDDRLFWAYDEWFGQAYGVRVDDHTIRRSGQRGTLLDLAFQGKSELALAPGESHRVVRQIFPAADALQVRGQYLRLDGQECTPTRVTVLDPQGPVANARLTLRRGDAEYASGRSDAEGRLRMDLPPGEYQAEVQALGRPTVSFRWDPSQAAERDVQLEACGYVQAEVTDAEGRPLPCKVAFRGVEGTTTPDFGPDSQAVATHELRYTADGRFVQELGPGAYDVIISRGPEYDAVFQRIQVRAGQTTPLRARLVRSIDTSGWVSADFHSHSSPSGDNTGSQLGRVLNLLAEHIEFAPCTEHNRIDSYVPHLQRLGCEHLLATCTGMELTGSPLPINHQNAFPLIHKLRTQDGGAPLTDVNPEIQIERLAMWDGGSDKLVQSNHPLLVQMLADRDQDGKYDGGFSKMFGFMDVVEVHPPAGILTPPTGEPAGRGSRNAIFHWLQMLNLGYRITGVVNTDAHYNHHGSGWLRNYIRSATDDPARIDTMEMVHASERGNLVMTTGPFLEATLTTEKDDRQYLPGDDVTAVQGRATLSVRVQCANWLDINRVQVLLNGRPVETLNWTRRSTPDRFGNGPVKFEHTFPLELAGDTHVIVVAAGEGLQLGPVMGDTQGKQMPIAVTNPIFVDVDGNGFQANGDQLDVPLPPGTPARTAAGG